MKITASERKGRPGTWEAKGQDPITLRRKSYYGKSAGEAEKKALASYGIIDPVQEVDPETLFGYYALSYLPTIAGTSENWQDQVAWAMDKYVLPKFGARKLDSLTRREFQSFFNGLKMKVSSKRKIKIVLGGVLNLAEDDEALGKNVSRRVRLPRDEPTNKKALTFDQLALLISHCHPRALPFVLFGSIGLRPGEACAPSWADFDGFLFKLRYQIRQPRGGAERTRELKTPQSARDIPLPQDLFNILKDAGQVSGIYVTSSSGGGYLLPTNATREFNAAMEAAKLGEYADKVSKKGEHYKAFVPLISPHELRHTFISLMENELEAPGAIVACLAGRKYDGQNAGYSHTHRKQLEKWMNRYWERLSTALSYKSVVQTA